MAISQLTREELEATVVRQEARIRHLLQSETVRLFDEVDPFTGEYKRDIKRLDTYGVADKLLLQEKANTLIATHGEEIVNAMRAIADSAGVLFRCMAEAAATLPLEKGRGS